MRVYLLSEGFKFAIPCVNVKITMKVPELTCRCKFKYFAYYTKFSLLR